jgi:signal transduction histidine kinase
MGVPLILDSGMLLGTICLVDPAPKQFSEDQLSAVTILSQQIARLIERDLSDTAAAHIDRDTRADVGAVIRTFDKQRAAMEMVLHDLLNPVGILRGYVDLLERGVFGPVLPEQAHTLSQMARIIRSIQRISSDMTDVIAAEISGILVTSTFYRPDVLVAHIGAICADMAAEQDLSLAVDIPEALPTVVGDPERVEQILINLVSNAIRYTAVGGVTLGAELLDDQIEYCVQDTGPGISPSDLDRVWELGVRHRRSEVGLGLGLYIVRRLAEAMGGSVSLESDLGLGSRFYVRLPLRIEGPTRVRLL